MSYNPTPVQKKHQKYAGNALIIVGAVTAIFSVAISPINTTSLLVGGILAALGQVMVSFAE